MRRNARFAWAAAALTLPLLAAYASAGSLETELEASVVEEHRPARNIEPIVSTDWLADNLNTPGVVVLDVRPADVYDLDHIPGAISEPIVVPFSAWLTLGEGDLLLEVPPEEELLTSIGNLGIDSSSRVVIVSDSNPDEPPTYGWANATRVADTLIYAGVRNVGILDGGFTKWFDEGRPTTPDVPNVMPVEYSGPVNNAMFVSKEYVQSRIGRAAIIDNRDPDVYFGVTIEPFAPQAGHIPSARSLPTPWIWQDGGIYRDPGELRSMAQGVVGWNRHHEVIVYCGVGGYASSWWYVLTQVLGYRNVKFYDGSAQEWVMTNATVPYHWY